MATSTVATINGSRASKQIKDASIRGNDDYDCLSCFGYQTFANVNGRKLVPDLTKHLISKLFGDRGYISQKPLRSYMSEGYSVNTR